MKKIILILFFSSQCFGWGGGRPATDPPTTRRYCTRDKVCHHFGGLWDGKLLTCVKNYKSGDELFTSDQLSDMVEVCRNNEQQVTAAVVDKTTTSVSAVPPDERRPAKSSPKRTPSAKNKIIQKTKPKSPSKKTTKKVNNDGGNHESNDGQPTPDPTEGMNSQQKCESLKGTYKDDICTYEMTDHPEKDDCENHGGDFENNKCIKFYKAGDFYMSRGANVRSSPNFYGTNNIIGQLPPGSDFTVLNKTLLPSGALSMEVEIVSPKNKTHLNEKKPLYVWLSKQELAEIKDWSKSEADTTCTDGSCDKQSNPSPFDDTKKILEKLEEQTETQKPAPSPTPSPTPSVNDGEQDSSTSTASSKKFSSMTKAEKDETIKRYAQSTQVAKTVAHAAKIGAGRSKRKCYRFVKLALALETNNNAGRGPGNLIPHWFGTPKPGYAKKAAAELTQFGFVNLLNDPDYKDFMKDPKNIPKGAVLVYSNNRNLAGHAEIKLDDGAVSRYTSDYTSTIPRANKPGYKLIGVMIKPNL